MGWMDFVERGDGISLIAGFRRSRELKPAYWTVAFDGVNRSVALDSSSPRSGDRSVQYATRDKSENTQSLPAGRPNVASKGW
jgi:hypothetical protein